MSESDFVEGQPDDRAEGKDSWSRPTLITMRGRDTETGITIGPELYVNLS